MTHAMSLDDFLGHDTRGGKSNYLDNWKKRQPPEIDTWLHTRAPVIALWQHNWPRLVERVVDDKKVLEVWGGQWNCHEAEEILKRQYFRDRETGERQMPPTICPLCLTLEAVRDAVESEKISWTDVIFRFVGEGGDDDNMREIHAGGFYGAFGRKDITDSEVKSLRKAGIRRDEAWREQSMAKCNYVFSVVDHASPEDGVQIAVETTLLGDRVKEVIQDAKRSLGAEEGNPMRHPYAIRWRYQENARQFGDKYKANRMEKLSLTDEIRRLIVDETPPSIEGLIRPGNPSELRTSMESAYCGPKGLLDFDALFAKAEEAHAEDNEERAEKVADSIPEAARTDENSVAAQSAEANAPTEDTPGEEAPVEQVDPDELVACDECNKPMKASDTVCPHCGFQYEQPEAPPPPMRKRSAAGKGKRDVPF